jgi:predicted nuclease of predicted toxin-antitoxin system
VRLLLDEMYSPPVAEQLRAGGHDAVSVHDAAHRRLEGAADAEVFAAAADEGRVLVTENVPDFSRLEAQALAEGRPAPALVFTTNRRFPRGDEATTGRLVRALTRLLNERGELTGSIFLEPAME